MDLGHSSRPSILHNYEDSSSFGPLYPFRNLFRLVTPSGRFEIRCCTLLHLADPDRQIINYEEHCLSASFGPLGPFQNLSWPMAPSSCFRTYCSNCSIGLASFQAIPKGRLPTYSRPLGSFGNLTQAVAPSGDLRTNHDRSTHHMETKVVRRPPRDHSSRFETSHRQLPRRAISEPIMIVVPIRTF